ncbi:MAG: BamA/TamA family outer membrane protein [Burkholderiaceae bacterium]|nr:BamA/TamA family outer membrane protein [Burkholderiaceae bacterium]
MIQPRAFWLCAAIVLAGGSALAQFPASPEGSGRRAAPDAASATPPGEPGAQAFDIEVRAANPELRALLLAHLELGRYRTVSDLDDAELARLVVMAERDLRNLAGTLGYFSPKILITRVPMPSGRPLIVVEVDAGAATLIGAVDIAFDGDIAQSTDPDALAQREALRRDWRLPVGRRFTQGGWDSAKTQAVRQLVTRRYPSARLISSLADVDAPAQRARLGLRLDSGPLYRLGPMQVSGMSRYDPAIVPRIARLPPGSVYDQNALMEAQLRLAASGYFESAYIFVDPEGDPTNVPVQVQLREAPLKKIILGIGGTTDGGPRASIEHTHHRVPGLDWRAVTKLQLERKSPFAQTEWTAPPDEQGWSWGVLGRAERVDDGTLTTFGQRLRVGRSRQGERIDRNTYLQYDRASVHNNAGGLDNTEAGDGASITANYVWTGRYFDSLPLPTRGQGLGFELGAGLTLNGQRSPFTRAIARWLRVQPLERGRIALRAEAGAVLARGNARIPSTQLFRTGGDTTVRGYGYRAIGVPLAGGQIGPGRYMAVGSLEWQRPILRDGMASDWEHTLFVDAGAVAERPQELRASVGVGTGVRWRSPIGPLQADIAYGVKAKRLRLHLAVGFVF